MGVIHKESTVLVAGARGLVGSAIVRKLKAEGYARILAPTHAELDYLNQASVYEYFRKHQIDGVYFAAARVGGIFANSSFQADFLYENITMAANTIHAAAESDVKKFLFLGSSCIYPKLAPQPLREESLLSGPLEITNEGYAIAKIAGLKLCEMYRRQYGKNFISAMPTNLYGPGDNFHPEHSHVIPGMMRRFHEAKEKGLQEVSVWGSGTPKREFLHVDDLAASLLVVMDKYEDTQTINVGTGEECTIRELAGLMKEVTGFRGEIVFDPSKPDGTPRKVLDISKLKALGAPKARSLRQGLEETYRWAVERKNF
jgi:GDP-L-fucose synthase